MPNAFMNMHRDDLVSVIVARDANGKRHAGWKSSRLAAFDACIVRDELVDELSSRLGLTFALGAASERIPKVSASGSWIRENIWDWVWEICDKSLVLALRNYKTAQDCMEYYMEIIK